MPMEVTSGEALSEGLGNNAGPSKKSELWLIGRGPEFEWRPAPGEAQPSAEAPKVVMGNQGTLLNVEDLATPRTPPLPPSGSAQAPRSALAWLGEDQPSAKRNRVIKMTYAGNKTHTYDPDSPNPEIPCPKCHEITSILSFVCNQCGFHLFKPPSEVTAKERKETLGLVQQYRQNNRSNRSDAGKIKQAMKSHKKFAKKTNPVTGEPFKSIQDRFENDVIYRYRMLSQGWSIEMLGPLQKLLQEDILPHQSRRTKAQIEQATTWYTTHPELGDGQPSAGNPDWNQTKVYRDQLHSGAASSSSAAAPAWSSDEWRSAPAAAPEKKQYYPKPPTTKPPTTNTNWWDKKW